MGRTKRYERTLLSKRSIRRWSRNMIELKKHKRLQETAIFPETQLEVISKNNVDTESNNITTHSNDVYMTSNNITVESDNITTHSDDVILKSNDVTVESNNVTFEKEDSIVEIIEEHDLIIEKSNSNTVVESIESNNRRIVDIGHLYSELQKVFANHSKGIHCEFKDWKLIKTLEHGLRTQLFFKCEMCHFEDSIWSEPVGQSDVLDTNTAAVIGSVSCGIGHSQLQELFAAMNVSSMSMTTYNKHMECVVDLYTKAAAENMKMAADLERKLALQRGDVIDGLPFITVVVDGSWMKRSYGTNYDSLSGAGAIVGYETGKVLFVGIRNKFCGLCDYYKRKGENPRAHVCFKNFNKGTTSAAMESDAIVEGFNCSVEMHGLIYKTFIADGDANVHKAIRDNDPYKDHGVVVSKIECSNHLFRNLCKKLRAIGEMPQPKGQKRKGFFEIRKLIRKNVLTMRKVIEDAIATRRTQNGSKANKEKLLHDDIINVTNHVFGNHSSCRDRSFENACKEMKVQDNVPSLKLHGFYDKIETAIRYLSAHSGSLLLNVTNNRVESFNSIICKEIAGKRINFGSRGQYNARVNAAVIQFNTQQVISEVCKFAGKNIPSTVAELEKQRQEKIARTRVSRAERGRHTSFKRSESDNKFYGLRSQKPDLSKEVFDRLSESHFQKLHENSANSENIERETRDQSRLELWFALRKNMITASNFGQICRMRETTSCAATVKRMLFPSYIDNAALQFGRDNEGNARAKLESLLNKTIRVCGLFIDAEYPYLGATPDGLIDDDGLVEIKCPLSAENMSAEEAVEKLSALRSVLKKNTDSYEMNKNHIYYYQVQGQLHVTRRKYCIFAVWTPQSVVTTTVYRNDDFWNTEMKTRLIRFYHECLLPEIIDSRYNRNMPIRDPQYILNAQEKAQFAKKNKEIVKSNASKKRKADTTSDDIIENSPEDKHCVIVNISERVDTLESLEARRNFIDNTITPLEDIVRNVSPINSQLNDQSLDELLRIIRATSDFETQSVLYIAYASLIKPVTKPSIQIIGGNCSGHWRCLYFDGEKLYVYDSLFECSYEKLSNEEKRYISMRYPLVKISEISFPRVQAQPDSYSCGIYAAAFAITVALHKDPCTERYCNDVALMRKHFIRIIETRKLSAFPTE